MRCFRKTCAQRDKLILYKQQREAACSTVGLAPHIILGQSVCYGTVAKHGELARGILDLYHSYSYLYDINTQTNSLNVTSFAPKLIVLLAARYSKQNFAHTLYTLERYYSHQICSPTIRVGLHGH